MITELISNPLLAGFVVLLITTLILIGVVIRMHLKMRKFLIGIDADNIRDSLDFVATGLKELQGSRSEVEEYLKSVEKRLRKSVQSVHTVRFNPFKGTGAGGNQSFATAFLNEEGNGVIVSSLYSRDHVSVFSKPLANYISEHELSDEEKEALETAKNKLK